ncbi:hypothetical protein BVRB_6g152220 [Beta vulgaris subsp. vulgaris]|nr:hypothetical protein BVRB_6g152220 [Beta vulgaris subsp. vulgaris]
MICLGSMLGVPKSIIHSCSLSIYVNTILQATNHEALYS